MQQKIGTSFPKPNIDWNFIKDVFPIKKKEDIILDFVNEVKFQISPN